MNIKTYLFDFDDTLIDTKIYSEIYQPILEMIKNKLKIEPLPKAQQLGLTKNRFNRYDTGDLCAELGLLKEYYQILEKKIKVRDVLSNYVIDVLTKLKKRNKKVAIISNSMKKTIKLYLDKYQLNHFITFIFSKDDAHGQKHQDQYWQTLIKKHHLNPKDCLVIGDHEHDDILMPQKFGFNTMLIKNPRELSQVLER